MACFFVMRIKVVVNAINAYCELFVVYKNFKISLCYLDSIGHVSPSFDFVDRAFQPTWNLKNFRLSYALFKTCFAKMPYDDVICMDACLC